MELKVKALRPGACPPAYATAGAAGMDLRACLDENGMALAPMQRAQVPTGIAAQLPEGTAGLVFARSGMALREGLAMANGVGVVDSDYRGELLVPVINLSAEPLHIVNGQRIAQLVLVPVLPATVSESDELSDTQRGAGGFGSTGAV